MKEMRVIVKHSGTMIKIVVYKDMNKTIIRKHYGMKTKLLQGIMNFIVEIYSKLSLVLEDRFVGICLSKVIEM